LCRHTGKEVYLWGKGITLKSTRKHKKMFLYFTTAYILYIINICFVPFRYTYFRESRTFLVHEIKNFTLKVHKIINKWYSNLKSIRNNGLKEDMSIF